MIKRIRALLERRKLDSEHQNKIAALEKVIGLTITSPHVYLKALRHRSLITEKDMAPTESYEQLEFMGDAILDFIVSEIIFQKYPKADEGVMTQLRSRLVKGEMLAKIARELELMNFIELGERVRNQGVEQSESVLADAFEALVGAVYLDHGYKVCRAYVMRLYQKHAAIDELISARDNFKSMLLEMAQAKKFTVPVYRIVDESGPGHDKIFEVEVKINDDIIGSGTGKNKKKAEQAAAEEALRILKNK